MNDINRVISAIHCFLLRPVSINNENFHNLLDYIHYFEDEYPATGFRIGCLPRKIGFPAPMAILCRNQSGARNCIECYACIHSTIITVNRISIKIKIFPMQGYNLADK